MAGMALGKRLQMAFVVMTVVIGVVATGHGAVATPVERGFTPDDGAIAIVNRVHEYTPLDVIVKCIPEVRVHADTLAVVRAGGIMECFPSECDGSLVATIAARKCSAAHGARVRPGVGFSEH